MRLIVGVLLVVTLLVLQGCGVSQQSYDQQVFVFNNTTYYLVNSPIETDRLGKRIGEITKRVKNPHNNGESNALPVGTKIFQVKGQNTSEALAIELGGGFLEAVNNFDSN